MNTSNSFQNTLQAFTELFLLTFSLKKDFDNDVELEKLQLKHDTFTINLKHLLENVPEHIISKTQLKRHVGWLNKGLSEKSPEKCRGDINAILETDLVLAQKLYIEDFIPKFNNIPNVELFDSVIIELISDDAEPISWLLKANAVLKKCLPDRRIDLSSERMLNADFFSLGEKQKFKKIMEAYRQIITIENNIVPTDWQEIHKVIEVVAKPRFNSGHYGDSVESAFKEINHQIKLEYKNLKGQELDGDNLMHKAFSPKDPVFKLNTLSTESDRNFQQGYMEIFAGCMKGIRNPKAHENLNITKQDAWEKIVLASHLMKVWDNRIQ